MDNDLTPQVVVKHLSANETSHTDFGGEQLLEILETSPVSIGIMTPDGNYIWHNSRELELHDEMRRDLNGQNIKSYFSNPSQHAELGHKLNLGGCYEDEEIFFKKKNGDKWWGLVTAYSIAFRNEPAIITWTVDITEQKDSQNEMLKAVKEAERANNAKSSFLATMSHEIRTPMNGIMGMIQLLDRTELGDEQRDMLKVVGESAGSLLTIIDDILDFSKIEASKLQLENVSMNLRDMIEGTVDLLTNKAQEKGVELLSYISPQFEREYIGDPVRLRQILINLLGNAIKFTDEGAVIVEVHPVKDGKIRFEVTDTGIGLTKEQSDKLFQPFVQAEASTTRKFGGSGLGLSISQSLVEMMGGVINIISAPNEGSTFWFDLSLDEGEALSESATHYNLEGLTALVVEENRIARRTISDYLEAQGVEVFSTKSAETGMKALQYGFSNDNPYDLALICHDPGGLDGVEAACTILEDDELCETGIIITTHSNDVEARRSAEWLGINMFLQKPFRAETLFSAVANVTHRKISQKEHRLLDVVSYKAPDAEDALMAGALILVAEDNPVNQMVIEKQLDELGFACHLVPNGAQAWKALEGKDYGLLLTDCHMPEMDGYKLTELVRQRELHEPERGRLPIIALTANALVGEAEKCRQAGMDDYLSKPVNMEDLERTVGEWNPGLLEMRVAIHDDGRSSDEAASIQDQVDALLNDGFFVVDPEEGSDSVDEGVLDMAFIEQNIGDLDFARGMLDVFITTTASTIEELHVYIKNKEISKVKEAAHSIKGAANMAGALSLGEVCGQIEDIALNAVVEGDLEPATPLIDQVDSLFVKVKKAIRDL
ncbi:putative Histidine kinase [Candidatus Terasakiella magnetica]|uniref:Sensory/regulatory protein RpfC n=1 Tax=Candidatus Terasakiella magnetica TaxID=1867952 RepID=A0A1C3RC79_9PROT|nr:response regulator [Candidatus Terasakiella magnetica]SCA54822.1 putative Histidine kinase [Candidatus Terasakiella magnetica]